MTGFLTEKGKERRCVFTLPQEKTVNMCGGSSVWSSVGVQRPGQRPDCARPLIKAMK